MAQEPNELLGGSAHMLGYRHLFYSNYGYQPIFDGKKGADYYSEYDMRSFTRPGDGLERESDMDDDPGFIDS